MSEPKAVAETVEEVVPGVWRWHVREDRIDFESDAHAVSSNSGEHYAFWRERTPAVLFCLDLIVRGTDGSSRRAKSSRCR